MGERNIHPLPLTCPQWGTWPATQACALTGNRTGDLLVCRPAHNPLSHTSQDIDKRYIYLEPRVVFQYIPKWVLETLGRSLHLWLEISKYRLENEDLYEGQAMIPFPCFPLPSSCCDWNQAACCCGNHLRHHGLLRPVYKMNSRASISSTANQGDEGEEPVGGLGPA